MSTNLTIAAKAAAIARASRFSSFPRRRRITANYPTQARLDLAAATAALLRATPPEHRESVMQALRRHFSEELARLHPDLLAEEIERRALAYQGAICAQL